MLILSIIYQEREKKNSFFRNTRKKKIPHSDRLIKSKLLYADITLVKIIEK